MQTQKIIVIIDNIRSRENVGSIFRTADSVGVSKIYLCGITPQPPHEKISKTALGAEIDVPWEYHKQTWRLIDKLKAEGWFIVALEKTPNSQDIFKIDIKNNKIALILGNEVNGLKPEIIKRSNETIEIPMYGKKESLNVSVAFGVAVYQLAKK